MSHILIVEDDLDIQDLLRNFLQEVGYEITIASDGMEAIALFSSAHFDLILLDIMLPKIDGFTVCELIRKQSQVPIIMLTARGDERDELLGFELGVDEYISKPFTPKIPVALVEAILRRTGQSNPDEILSAGGIVIDKAAHQATVDDKPMDLSFKEFELLKLLMVNAGIVLHRDTIMSDVWGTDYEGESRTLDMHIKTLRQKLGEAGNMIKTVRNVGYKME